MNISLKFLSCLQRIKYVVIRVIFQLIEVLILADRAFLLFSVRLFYCMLFVNYFVYFYKTLFQLGYRGIEMVLGTDFVLLCEIYEVNSLFLGSFWCRGFCLLFGLILLSYFFQERAIKQRGVYYLWSKNFLTYKKLVLQRVFCLIIGFYSFL